MKHKKIYFVIAFLLAITGIFSINKSTVEAVEKNKDEVEVSSNNLFDFEAFIKQTDIIDGTAPFDKDNSEGNDSDSKNGIVRSFDTITYPLKITINPKKVSSLSNIVLKITGTLENGISESRVNAKYAVGGYEDIAKNIVGFEQTYTVAQTGNSIMIPISIEVQGAKNGIKLKPKLQVEVVSVDGVDIRKDKVITNFDDLPTVSTSSKVSIKTYVGSGHTGAGIPYYPYAGITGDSQDKENTHSFSVAFGLEKLTGKTDIRGATFPTGELKYHIDLTGSVYWDGGKKKGESVSFDFANNDKPLYLIDQQPINGNVNRVGKKNTLFEEKQYRYGYANNYMTAISGFSDLRQSTIDRESYRSVWDSGEWTVNKPKLNENVISYYGSNKDYIVGSTFPEYRSDGYTGGKIYGQNDKIFSTNAFIMLMPNEYRIGGKHNKEGYANNAYYKATVVLDSYIDDSGKEIKINKTATFQASERNNPNGAYSIQTTLHSYPKGQQLGTPNIGWSKVSKGDVSTILGEDVKFIASLGSSVVSYGGFDAVFRWNTDSFELTEQYANLAEGSIYSTGYFDPTLKKISNDKINQKIFYGVQTFNDNTFEQFTKRGRNDYKWYTSYKEAIKNGEVGAILNSINTPTGPKWTSSGYFPLKVKTKKIGSFNEKNTANIILTNYYAYPEEERKKEVDVTGSKTYLTPSIWNEAGELVTKQTPVGDTINFETLSVLNAETSSNIKADKTTFYNSEEVTWTIDSSIVLPTTGSPEGYDGSVQVKQILPKGLDYKVGSGKQGTLVKEPKIIKNDDGTTILLWDLLVSGKDNKIDRVTYKTTINPFALSSGVQSSLTVKNIISSDVDTRRENLRTSTLTINVLKVGMVGIYENIDSDNGEKNSTFTVRLKPYTTIEEEYDVKGITILPFNQDKLGSEFKGKALLNKIKISGGKPVSIYLNDKVVESSVPQKINLKENGWYKYTDEKMDLSKVKTMLFHVEGVLANTDNIEIAFDIKTVDNDFGNMYLNETLINSATDYKLSPISNKVKYTIKADVELNLERIQIYTANAKKDLPVKLRINKDIIREKGINEPLKLVLYEKETNKKVYEKAFKVSELERENSLKIPKEYLVKNTNKSYEARVEGYNTNRVYVKKEADKIDTLGYTASEEKIQKQAKDSTAIEYEGVIMTEREIGKVIETYNETLKMPLKKIKSVKSGYGFEQNQQIEYKNDISIKNIIPTKLLVLLDPKVVDGSLYTTVGNKKKIDLIHEEIFKEETLIQSLKYPKVYVQEKDGKIYSEQQYANKDDSIVHNVIEGGNKVYIPIWIDTLGSYEYLLKNETPIGVNEINVEVTDSIDVTAFMYGHIGSKTIKKDEILIEPVNVENPFPNGLPKNWTNEDLEWIKK